MALFLVSATYLHAQSYPNQAINLVIPLAPGDAADVASRTMGEELSKLLKVPVVAVNRPGGGMTIGTDSVVKAKKDGYTILLTTNAALVSNRILNPETASYDPLKDLTPLGLSRERHSHRFRQDAIQKLRRELNCQKNPGKILGNRRVWSAGHPNIEMINCSRGRADDGAAQGGARYHCGPGGHVEGGRGALSSHLKSGALRGMVISSHFPDHAEIPTLPQLGYRQKLLGVWFGFFAPAGVPTEVTKALVPAIEKAVKEPAVASKLASLGIVQDYQPPEKLVAEIREEHQTIEDIAKKAGL
jgi:tripartite-type tricarboxylate transporter receptor subunit TctC